VLAAKRALFSELPRRGIPIVHLLTQYRDAEEMRLHAGVARAVAQTRTIRARTCSSTTSPACPASAIMPQVLGRRSATGSSIRRSVTICFIGTDLDFALRAHGINTVFITGVNTNSCVLSTACAACSRDYAVVVIEDCVDTHGRARAA